jgi:hypothetical protein
LGRHHRILFHDPLLACVIARREYPNDSNAVLAVQCHIALDNICTRNPTFKKTLMARVQLAKLSGKKKRSQRTPIGDSYINETDSIIRTLRQLMDLFSL